MRRSRRRGSERSPPCCRAATSSSLRPQRGGRRRHDPRRRQELVRPGRGRDLRTRKQLAGVVAANPFLAAGEKRDPATLHVALLDASLPQPWSPGSTSTGRLRTSSRYVAARCTSATRTGRALEADRRLPGASTRRSRGRPGTGGRWSDCWSRLDHLDRPPELRRPSAAQGRSPQPTAEPHHSAPGRPGPLRRTAGPSGRTRRARRRSDGRPGRRTAHRASASPGSWPGS